ncbi:hypothetical protein LCGC14_0289560 [marine sediment metagenome]|uniref:Uncharacterized protein n=1 Tax=marine sediment metagenome TaxID=412755 RepID=A0A0F9TYV1_9ZZZZ
MNLHEIIHAYLRMKQTDSEAWLRELVQDAGLSVCFIKHIAALRE